MIDRYDFRDDDAVAGPVALFVHRVLREILRDVVARALVTQAVFLERVPHVELAIRVAPSP